MKVKLPDAKSEPGEFTQMFRPPAAPEVDAPAATVPPPQPAQPKPSSGPGDFTRMFSAPAAQPPAPKSPEPPSPPPGSKPPNEPGSFTAFFSKPAAPAPATPAPPPVSSPPQESEFTRFFSEPLPSTGREVNWKAIENQPPPPAAPKGPGEFTRMFGRAQTAGKGPLPEGGATDLFQSSRPASPAANSATQVDDFAKVFAQKPNAAEPTAAASVQVQASPAPAAKPVVPAAVKPAGPPMVVLVIIILAVVVLAGCALYYFVFRK